MRSISTISKVSPLDLPQVKRNNFLYNGVSIIKQIKWLIYVESVLGITRLYLLQYNKVFLSLTYLYASVLMISAVLVIARSEMTSSIYFVVQTVLTIEYLGLIASAILTKKKKLNSFFQNLSKFDHIFKVSSDHEFLSTTKKSLIWTCVTFAYNIMEFLLFDVYISNKYSDVKDYSFLVHFVTSLGHDMEQIFFFTLLRIIFTRLQLVKAHVNKAFGVNNRRKSNKKTDKIETLSNNAQLDIASLHKVYELLHKCSEQLNSIMSFPMLLIMFASGFTTTMLLKLLVKVIQINEKLNPNLTTISVIYLVVKCVKYTLFVVVPCYYSSITSAQVSNIRTTLHDSLNTMPLDKLERRRVKAFFLLTKESEFTYAFGGVIKLDMTLPLSYTSLCTTYLVIIIQFSKFLD